MTIIEQITSALGEYTPIVTSNGDVVTNWGQIASYALIVTVVFCVFKLTGLVFSRR